MMEMIIYLLLGVVIGGVIGFFVFKLILQQSFVVKADFEDAQRKISALQLENATKLSKEEVAQKYVTKELHDSINSNLTVAKNDYEKEKEANETNRKTILRLTSESEQKLT